MSLDTTRLVVDVKNYTKLDHLIIIALMYRENFTQTKKIIFILLSLISFNVVAQTFGELTTDKKFSEQGTASTVEGKLIEEGQINDVIYRFYYSDSGGPFNSNGTKWSVYCTKDQITDRKNCVMSTDGLLVVLYPRGVSAISIGADHFPGSAIIIRIDGGKAISAANGGPFSKQASQDIVKRLVNAKKVNTRYMEWPYQTWDDKTFDLYAFKEAYSYMQWAINRIK